MGLLKPARNLSLIFRAAVARFRHMPAVTARQAYDASTLKQCVDAIADFSGAARDENGSFEVTVEAPGEKTHFSFVGENAKGQSAVSVQFASVKKNRDMNGPVKVTTTFSRSGNYKILGDNVVPLTMKLPSFIPFIGGRMGLSPEDFTPTLLKGLSVAAPSLYNEVARRTALTVPKEPETPEEISRAFLSRLGL